MAEIDIKFKLSLEEEEGRRQKLVIEVSKSLNVPSPKNSLHIHLGSKLKTSISYTCIHYHSFPLVQ